MLAVAGSEARAGDDDDAVTDPPIVSGQGIQLHGTGRFERVNIPTQSATLKKCDLVTVSRGALQGFKRQGNVATKSCQEKDFVGVTFAAPYAGKLAHFTIQDAKPHQNAFAPSAAADPNGPWEYNVRWRLDSQAGPLCPNSPGNAALVVPHAWTTSGELIPNPLYFTFACVPASNGKGGVQGGGAIAKCVDWGYPPWANAGKTLAGNALKGTTAGGNTLAGDEKEALRFHQACVHMATADYCGEGKVNTLEDTPIAFFDVLNVRPEGRMLSPVAAGERGYQLEAAWGVDERGRARTLCFSKFRWSTLPLDAACIQRVGLDPGQTEDTLLITPPPPTFCDDLSIQDLEKQGALLFSYSIAIDRNLVRFRAKAGDAKAGSAYVTTSQVLVVDRYAPLYQLDGPLQALQPAFEPSYELEGPILSPRLPASVASQFKLAALYRCKKDSADGPLFLTTTDPRCEHLPGYRPDGALPQMAVEGYIYASNPPGDFRGPLVLWKDAQGRYATSTLPPQGGTYQKVRVLGYLPPVAHLASFSGP